MTTVLCTLYNSLYLDKGLVLYDSLCNCAKDFKLYVLCMDDKCCEVLIDLHQEHHIPVKLSDFEAGDDALLEAKSNRPMGEYCWTCSSSFIRYILRHYGEDSCTYIDADMFFYNDPQILVDEMLSAGKSVMVVPHRFPEDKKDLAKTVGDFCVEFNTFLNTPESLEVLEHWRKKCLECCSNLGDGMHWGDQKYLEELVDKYDCVHVCENPGAGIAPWNISLYHKTNEEGCVVYLKTTIQSLFFHFQGLTYLSNNLVAIGVDKDNYIDTNLIKSLYTPYLSSLNSKKKLLKDNYNLDCLITAHPSLKQKWKRLRRTILGHIIVYLSFRLRTKAMILRVK